jgi:hypothetical protein
VEDNNELTLRDLLALASEGDAAEFTAAIQDLLNLKAEDTIVEMVVEGPEEEEEEWEFEAEDDIEDLPLEDDDLEEDIEDLEERNALNHQRSRAFRAGTKEQNADQLSTSVYRSSRDSAETHRKEVDSRKARKTTAQAKAKGMFADAQEKGVKMGGKAREMGHIRDAGKKVAKGGNGWEWKRDQSTTASNASEKKFHGGQGKFLHRHLQKQHSELSRRVDDLHNDIRRSLDDHARISSNKEKFGDSFGWDSEKTGKPSLTPHHLENIKKLHSKLTHLHHAVKALHVEEIDYEAVFEDLEELEAEFGVLTEGYSFSRRDPDDDSLRTKGGAKKYSHRRDRRMAKMSMEEVEPLALRDDLSDEELFDLAETITEDEFEMLDELSQATLGRYMGAADNAIRAAKGVYGAGRDKAPRRAKGFKQAGDKWLAKKEELETDEDDEQLDELSQKALGRYMGKAVDDLNHGPAENRPKRKVGMRKASTKWLAKKGS